MDESLAVRLAVSLGIGLLVGAERERRKGSGPGRGPAGLRTFAVTALVGGVSLAFGGELVLVASALVVGALAIVAYGKSRGSDPGITSEVSLVATLLLGALAVRDPALAAGLAVVTTILLASRTRLHRFVGKLLTEQELHDALVFAAAILVVLPLTPDRGLGPLGVPNPRTVWRLVVVVMAASAAGYVSLRTLGPRYGLPLSGFAAGFVSSAATIASMGRRAVADRGVEGGAVAGAVLSTVATVVQLVALLAVTSRPCLAALSRPVLFAGGAAVLYGAFFAIRGARKVPAGPVPPGHAFDLRVAVLFAALVSLVMLGAAAVAARFGERGLLLAATAAGFADAHSAAASVASLVASGRIAAPASVLPILAVLTANTVTKAVLAGVAGGRRFAARVIPGLVLVILAAWAGALPLP
jgi:uncharacterized membrane protein (DUF4010 family)